MQPHGEVAETTTPDPITGQTVVTNLRLPGQYDERLFAAAGLSGLQGPYYNWNRWYLPGVARYLELDPEGLTGNISPRSETGGRTPEWYGYAGGNPLRFVDPTGLYTKDPECKNFPDEGLVMEVAERITETCLRQCVYQRIQSGHLDCNTKKKYCRNHPKVAGNSPLGNSCDDPDTTVFWCSRDLSISCQAKALVHEFAHLCGWDHKQGKNVPGDSGTLKCN